MTTETIMSIEQKAKAYDEALKRAEAAIDIAADKDLVKGVAITIFPELKESEESEDERIRKAIVEFFESEPDNTTYSLVPKRDILAWLEKQKEQKHAEWSEEDEHRCKDAIYFLETAKKHYADTSEIELTIEWLKSLRPQSKGGRK